MLAFGNLDRIQFLYKKSFLQLQFWIPPVLNSWYSKQINVPDICYLRQVYENFKFFNYIVYLQQILSTRNPQI